MTGTTKKLRELMARDLGGLELLTTFIDGIETAEHTIVAALGVDGDGYKHPLGLWEGSTESKAWQLADAVQAEQELRTLARQLQADRPGAASLREGLEETLTVTRLGLSPSLLRTFKSTNPIESMISVARDVTGNVERWRDGSMICAGLRPACWKRRSSSAGSTATASSSSRRRPSGEQHRDIPVAATG